jgi:hypothetical protein
LNVFLRTFTALLCLVALFGVSLPAAAQEGGALVLGAPNIEEFPTVRFTMDAYTPEGRFWDELTGESLQIRENGQPVQPETVEITPNGLQVILALNTSPWMAGQNGGATAYQHLQTALLAWARSQQGNTLDDYSLSTPTGLYLIREQKPDALVKALENYQPDLLKSQPALGSLAEALDLATDPLNQPLMKRVVLFITPALPANTEETLQDLASRALGIGVRVHVLFITQPGAGVGPVEGLRALSDRTGGQFHEVTLPGGIPEVEPMFAPLRQTYLVGYVSAANRSGSHSLSVSAGQGGQTAQSNTARFDLKIEPPRPIFLSPPASVLRAPEPGGKNPAQLLPETVALQILVEFPDQYERPLRAARLYVNGELATENTREPFDRFQWSVAEFGVPARQSLRVEVEDTLGLRGNSIEIPVEILVDQPATASLGQRISERGLVAVGAIGAAGTSLAFVLAVNSSKRRTGKRASRANRDKKQQKDPVSQPVPIAQEPARQKSQPREEKSSPLSRPFSRPLRAAPAWTGWASHNNPPSAPARLVALNENEEPVTGGSIALARQEITFGSDPRRATQVLTSATVDGLHARMQRTAEGEFILSDQGSVAGTWVNYAPVTSAGARLEHGDLIHIGKAVFRFELAEPGRLPHAEVQVMDLER